MDPLSIDSLITAARLIEKSQLLQGFPIMPLNTQLQLSTAQPLSRVNENFFNEQVQPGLCDFISGKMEVERKCSASTSSPPYCGAIQRKSSTKHSRAAHNELEKTRRANLRTCLEKLKSLVPPVSDAARNTTLALLTRARDHIKTIDNANAIAEIELAREREENSRLRAELELLRTHARASLVPQQEDYRRDESRPASGDSRLSPMFFEYSPSSKPAQSPRAVLIDPVAEGLLPALPISFPRPSVYPFFDLNPLPASQRQFLPIHLSV